LHEDTKQSSSHITVWKSRAARRAEGTLQEPKFVYNIDEVEAQAQTSEKQVKEKASSACQSEPILIFEDVADQRVFFSS
jgi:hypothetical protein